MIVTRALRFRLERSPPVERVPEQNHRVHRAGLYTLYQTSSVEVAEVLALEQHDHGGLSGGEASFTLVTITRTFQITRIDSLERNRAILKRN